MVAVEARNLGYPEDDSKRLAELPFEGAKIVSTKTTTTTAARATLSALGSEKCSAVVEIIRKGDEEVNFGDALAAAALLISCIDSDNSMLTEQLENLSQVGGGPVSPAGSPNAAPATQPSQARVQARAPSRGSTRGRSAQARRDRLSFRDEITRRNLAASDREDIRESKIEPVVDLADSCEDEDEEDSSDEDENVLVPGKNIFGTLTIALVRELIRNSR